MINKFSGLKYKHDDKKIEVKQINDKSNETHTDIKSTIYEFDELKKEFYKDKKISLKLNSK
jgi:hypothetical protein